MHPASTKAMEELGQRLKDARLRRKLTMEALCLLADISRPTLYKVESGDPTVAFGIYVQVMSVLRLTEDLSLLAKEDRLGRQLQDESLPRRKRAIKRQRQNGAEND
jgi:transcriptional regulator with XRE-family HTH domain